MIRYAAKPIADDRAARLPHRSVIPIACALCALFMLSAPLASAAMSAKDLYFKADARYRDLRHDIKKQRYRYEWLTCIHAYQAVYEKEPSGPWAAAGLFMSGKLYRKLFHWSGRSSDREEAQDSFERLLKRYPHSRYRARSQRELAALGVAAGGRSASPRRPARAAPRPNLRPAPHAAAAEAGPNATGPSIITDLRHWSNPSYTRIVIDASEATTYTHRLLKRDPSLHKPQRLYVDLANCRLAKGIQRVVSIDDDLLRDARAGQYRPDTVRVVVDLKSFNTYKIFSLRNPFRIVLDIWGTESDEASRPATHLPAAGAGGKHLAPGALARQLALGVKRIVVDPGHGGKDDGAPGYLKGVYEKNVTLAIAKRLARKIRRELGCQVIMTRTTDKYLTLEERTAIANTSNADLFISIHCNSSRNRRTYGTATYFLNLATDSDAIQVAARENATSTKNISDLESILNDLMRHTKVNESSRFALCVQQCLCKGLERHYSFIRDRGVKQAPFYVLLGARMPAILVETSFISNPRECRRLINPRYQDRLAEDIVRGIRTYVKEINPSAFARRNQKGRVGG